MSPHWLVTAALALGCTAPSTRPVPNMDPARFTPELEARLEAQFAHSTLAWNRGDLDGFMADFAPDTLPTFIAGGHLRRGFDFIRRNYAPWFAPGAARDSLRFEEFDVRPISDGFVLVTARFILYRNGTTSASGPFTLLMEHRPEGWKILHDHSSSD